ncbi:unnamed protein product, partial [Staurois parvus]
HCTAASSCCCQARNLPWAPVPTPHADARPVNLSWAPVPASSCCCPGSRSVSWVPVRPPIAAVPSPSPHPHLPCATFRSPHTAGGFHFFIGCCIGLPLLLPPHCGSVTLWFLAP